MAKSNDPYNQEYQELAGGDVGSQYLEKLRQQKGQTDWMQKAAESLSGVAGAGKEAYQASKKDTLASLADEQYRRRRTPIGSALTASEQRRRTAQRGFAAKDADMAKSALHEGAAAEMAFAKVEETKLNQGMESEKTLEALAAMAPMVEGWKKQHDWSAGDWDNDEEGFFNSAYKFAMSLPPHMREQFMDMHVMPTYLDWGGSNPNPFSGPTKGAVANQDEMVEI